ncbi:INSIG family protein [Aspergillus clavatus NRRL 1]|uniref:INSIG domain protein n=1 Tax=Aspergillus clavatus (strain ATCC 1007 / CBS 513.65 / DSM 816 / NCTC 3887 / NRRL 1 / QM 1276 / 107) TaxID=344612 RepID=A1CH80_ASPCL|nr:INSIG domain protein [Aspergillus clavatus NRRL 1]EAW10235.1 INSIG domain protein [Aspergillus clavatus NRRL 1]
MSDEPTILRPRPRRIFDLTPSNESSETSTPAEPANPDLLNPKETSSTSVSRNASILNLTSSTLYGIYSPTAFESTREESSPWGTEAQTPSSETLPAIQTPSEGPDPLALQRTRSRLSHGLFRGVILPQVVRSALLFGFGVIYGVITVHLHENHWITPVKLENIHDYDSWQYLGFWGFSGVALGNFLPWLDSFAEQMDANRSRAPKGQGNTRDREDRTPAWVSVARSVGAFVGIAFALRKLPWESTTQASATLALVNPVLWYLIDRTKAGFLLSTVVGLAGTAVVLGLKPELIPTSTETPAASIPLLNNTSRDFGLVSGVTQEGAAVRIWLASVLFCACVCFGNVGRQLAIGGGGKYGLE